MTDTGTTTQAFKRYLGLTSGSPKVSGRSGPRAGTSQPLTSGAWTRLAAATTSYPLVWIGSSLALGKIAGTYSVKYADLLHGDRRTLVTRVALPQALALTGTLLWAHRERVSLGEAQPTLERTTPVKIGAGWVAVGTTALSLLPKRSDQDAYDLLTYGASMLVIGAGEEAMYRGLLPALLRREGLAERDVALASTAAFALLHAPNVALGARARDTLGQLVITFIDGFGLYSVARVTRSLTAAAVSHAAWDFTVGRINPDAFEPAHNMAMPSAP